jgi:hypothetical protein
MSQDPPRKSMGTSKRHSFRTPSNLFRRMGFGSGSGGGSSQPPRRPDVTPTTEVAPTPDGPRRSDVAGMSGARRADMAPLSGGPIRPEGTTRIEAGHVPTSSVPSYHADFTETFPSPPPDLPSQYQSSYERHMAAGHYQDTSPGFNLFQSQSHDFRPQ